MRKRGNVLLLNVAQAVFAASMNLATAPPEPTPQDAAALMDDIFKRVQESNEKKAARMRCKKLKVVTDLKTGRVKAIEVYDVYGKDGVMTQRKIKQKDASRDSAANNQRDIDTYCAACKDVNKEELLGLDLNDPAFMEMLDFTYSHVQGDQYVYKMSPSKGASTATTRFRDLDGLDELLKRMDGEVHVDPQRKYILQMYGSVQPFRKFMVFYLSEFIMQIEQSEIDGMILTRQITITVRYSTAGSVTHERHVITFKDFEIAPPVPQEPVQAPQN